MSGRRWSRMQWRCWRSDNLSYVKQRCFPSRNKVKQFNLCKVLWPLPSFLELHAVERRSLAPDEWHKQIFTRHFYIHVKKKSNFPWCNDVEIQIVSVKWLGRPVAVWIWLSQSRAPGVSRLRTCFENKMCWVYMSKWTCLHGNWIDFDVNGLAIWDTVWLLAH